MENSDAINFKTLWFCAFGALALFSAYKIYSVQQKIDEEDKKNKGSSV
jgi:hypothetical protein